MAEKEVLGIARVSNTKQGKWDAGWVVYRIICALFLFGRVYSSYYYSFAWLILSSLLRCIGLRLRQITAKRRPAFFFYGVLSFILVYHKRVNWLRVLEFKRFLVIWHEFLLSGGVYY